MAQDTAFTYPGQLASSGQPATGSYDLQATRFDAELDGAQVGPVVVKPAVIVTGGFFTTSLDFGAGVFNGAPRWLELAVRPAGGAGFTPLAPRQPLAAAPYALYAMTPGGTPGSGGRQGSQGAMELQGESRILPHRAHGPGLPRGLRRGTGRPAHCDRRWGRCGARGHPGVEPEGGGAGGRAARA